MPFFWPGLCFLDTEITVDQKKKDTEITLITFYLFEIWYCVVLHQIPSNHTHNIHWCPCCISFFGEALLYVWYSILWLWESQSQSQCLHAPLWPNYVRLVFLVEGLSENSGLKPNSMWYKWRNFLLPQCIMYAQLVFSVGLGSLSLIQPSHLVVNKIDRVIASVRILELWQNDIHPSHSH